jgi:PhnB protein
MNASSTASFAVHEVYPYLRVRDAPRALTFYQRAFGAQELFRLTEPDGRIGHAEIRIGATTLMLSEEYPELGLVGPQALGGTTFSIHLHVDDADAWIARAVEAGATIVRPATDAFYGERGGTVRDPFGHEWMLGHQIEEVSVDEMQRRYTALFAEDKR